MANFQNIFSEITNTDGTFFTFSQYIEDLQRMITDSTLWKVVPSTFSVYTLNNFTNDTLLENLNDFEETIYTLRENSGIDSDDFKEQYNTISLFSEGPYYTGDITLHAYNEYDNYGYSELVCHIPESAKSLLDSTAKYFTFDSLVIFYNIYTEDTETPIFENIPMGLYISGSPDNGLNTITKWVENDEILYGTGTSYTLRLSGRFITGTSFETLIVDDETANNANYSQILKDLGSTFSSIARHIENDMEKMYTDSNKIFYSLIKNNKINIPYTLDINGKTCWFVNGNKIDD